MQESWLTAAMIIDRIEPLALRLPITRPAGADALYLVLCKVTERSGLVGYGECLCLRAASQRSLVAAISDVIAPHVLGKPIDQRERLNVETRVRLASFGRAGTNLNALAAVDMALWDIAGKAAGQSLSTLLGGARRARVPVMASLDRYNDAAKVTARIAQALEARVAAVKVHEFDLDVIEAARKVAGPQIPFVADCNNAHTMAQVQASLARWQALDLLFLEDPAWPPEALLEATPFPKVTIGLGADLGSAEQLAVYARAPSVGVVQPDICMIGGVSEIRRAMDLLGPLGVSIAPHTPFVGPAALATLHVLATMKEAAYFAVIEAEPHMAMYGDGLFTRWQPDLAVPTGPGLGFDPDPAWLKEFATA
jgi:L-alanine-DL-glutamate epimerase-like enolase superfamily enzyme